jgi:protein SCO1/2
MTVNPIRSLAAALIALALVLVQSAAAQVPPPPEFAPAANTRPKILEQARFEQRLGGQLPLDAVFKDEEGRTVKLGDYFGKRPVVLAFVYFQCPMLCSQVLNGLTGALAAMKFTAGKEFDVIAISFDPRDTPATAADAKAKYSLRYGRKGSETGWHFLTGDAKAIAAATEAAGFHYVWDNKTQQFAHASGVIVATPQGKLAQYFYGIEFSPRDLRLAMVESSEERLGTVVDSLTLYCYHYDPTSGKYGAVIMNMMRVGAIATMLALGSFMLVMFRRDRRGDGMGREAGPA